uniref:DnaJ homologue subfamily C member 28 conserved domain-containing protein n=1 Tax=Chromera velia CCMP2878 TaxID=1169474 RepID=A0A0G4FWQ6_9ALVE|eukprot:Cvel_19044.t1-p1 / transcript=Cvel_19044.t1 / gene=Cvel_19044 / organism=Chromera_velia_CCMP2878 / gene_product=hypothetical protein / transcript_product=hypothetical protein / location=Cvel_scaffold1614:35554-42598(+) / protein_length=518 / sequence_SO=supercontig / SO=protein_coding / is_pseudo=false
MLRSQRAWTRIFSSPSWHKRPQRSAGTRLFSVETGQSIQSGPEAMQQESEQEAREREKRESEAAADVSMGTLSMDFQKRVSIRSRAERTERERDAERIAQHLQKRGKGKGTEAGKAANQRETDDITQRRWLNFNEAPGRTPSERAKAHCLLRASRATGDSLEYQRRVKGESCAKSDVLDWEKFDEFVEGRIQVAMAEGAFEGLEKFKGVSLQSLSEREDRAGAGGAFVKDEDRSSCAKSDVLDWEKFDEFVEGRIQVAMAEGAFEGLEKFKGVSLQSLSEREDRAGAGGAFVKDEDRMANRVMKNHGFAPEWIEIRKEVKERLRRAKERLKEAYELQEEEGLSPKWMMKKHGEFRDEIEELNRRVRDVNLICPPSCQMARMDRIAEMEDVRRQLFSLPEGQGGRRKRISKRRREEQSRDSAGSVLFPSVSAVRQAVASTNFAEALRRPLKSQVTADHFSSEVEKHTGKASERIPLLMESEGGRGPVETHRPLPASHESQGVFNRILGAFTAVVSHHRQ